MPKKTINRAKRRPTARDSRAETNVAAPSNAAELITTTTDVAGGNPPVGLPAPDTIVAESTLISPTGRRYQILRTSQRDPDDSPGETKSPCTPTNIHTASST